MSVVIVGGNECMELFTNTVSHKMVRSALSEVKSGNNKVVRCHTSSMAALKNILEEHTA